ATWDSNINFTPDAIDSFKTDLKNNIKLYSNTIYNVFHKGLASYGNPSDLESFAKKQKYIEIMTTHCLDFARLFPTFDPDLYPTGSGDISLQKTRRILSPLIPIRAVNPLSLEGTPVDTSNWPDYENGNGLLPNPRDRVLKQLTFHSSSRGGPQPGANAGYTYLWGVEVLDSVESRLYGKLPTVDPQKAPNNVYISPSNPIVQIKMDTWQAQQQADHWNTNIDKGAISNLSFLQQDGTWINLQDRPGGTAYSLPAAHYLSYLYGTPFNTDNAYDAHVSALVGVSTPMEAIAGQSMGEPDENGNISSYGFAWENGIIDNGIGSLQVVKEAITGTNVVKLNYQQILKMGIGNSAHEIPYSIRVRYASKNDVTGYFHMVTSKGDQLVGEVTFPSTEVDDISKMVSVQGDNGKFALKEIATNFIIPRGSFDVYIQNNSEENFYLDRIEFVPYVAPIEPDPAYTKIADIQPRDIPNDDGITIWESSDGKSADKVDVTVKINQNVFNLVGTVSYQGNPIGNIMILDTPSPGEQSFTWNKGKFDKVTLYGLILDDEPTFAGSVVSGAIYRANENTRNYFTKPRDLTNITNQVHSLFVSGTQNRLAQNISDHDIEEVVLKVDALSDEVFGEEKKALRKLVNQAKRLSKARNLLVGGSFENWDAWYKGRSVVRLSDHELLKSDYVFLPPPRFSPSYIFQKVEESKLKANTRYVVSGFIAHAEDLEIVVSRYGQEIQKVVQVPYGEAFPLTSGGVICCMSRPMSDRKSADPHFFSYSIDVGELDMTAGPGIEFGLRIVGRTGMASVSNLEIREERSLKASEIRQVQRVARNWRTEYEKERAEVTSLIQPVINRINGLYENGNWNGSIRSDISYQNIDAIVLPTLPKLRHWFMSDRFSEQGDIMAKFQSALNRAYAQLEQNTLLHNGHFTKDAANWTIEGDAHQITLEDGRHVLRLPDWSSSVSQMIEIENFDPDKEYNLVLHGQGEGTVTLEHGEETKYIETHTHHFANFTTSQRQGLTFESNKVTVTISSEDGEFLVDNIALVEVPMFNKNQMVNENKGVNINSNTNMNSSNNSNNQ
ncbi:TPA: insecticidal delta-endotoxin Cry8Ea1 family protein, partial [Bacillus cereus]